MSADQVIDQGTECYCDPAFGRCGDVCENPRGDRPTSPDGPPRFGAAGVNGK